MIKYREAVKDDIPQIQVVRNSVKENMLSNPALVSDADCEEFMFNRGKGWVAESEDRIVGFAIADLKEDNIWALFVHPDFENKGIGKELHRIMMDWYFSTGKEKCWLGTAPGTRAQIFYSKQGWKETGMHGKEVKFEITADEWKFYCKCFSDIKKVNISEKLSLFSDHWNPRIAGELNGQHIKLVKFKGEFVWHKHDDEDEMFYVLKGRFSMQFRDKTIEIRENEFLIVPKGVEHRPVAAEEVSVMLFEPVTTLNTGDTESDLTRKELQKI